MGAPRTPRSGHRGATLTVATVPTRLARQQIASLRGKARASFLLAVEDIRHRGCAAAGVRLTGEALSGICRLDLYGAWRLLTVFEAPDRCVMLLVAEHTRSTNPYRLLYAALGLDEPEEPGPSHHAAMPKGSLPSIPTSLNDSNAACEISAALRCPPAPGHPLGGAASHLSQAASQLTVMRQSQFTTLADYGWLVRLPGGRELRSQRPT